MLIQSALTCIFLILFTQLTGQIINYIQVLKNDALVNFPESIDFALSLESKTPVERITLIYGTNATSCSPGGARQAQDFNPHTAIELEWQWDLKRSGSVPPGAEIWWQWEIEDEDGGIFLTDRQSMLVIDDRHSWQETSEANVTVYWYAGDAAFGQTLLALAVDSLARLSSEAGVATENPIQVWAYPTAADVRDAVVNTPEWVGGVAYPDYGIAIVAFRPGEDEEPGHVIPHEIAHLVEGSVIFNCRGGRMPTWLSEGLAEFSAGGRSQSSMARLEASLEQGRLPPLNLLSRGFSAYTRGADLAYTQSTAVVTYLLETFGPEMMADLIDKLRSGKSINDALLMIYGFDTEGLDAEWRLSKGYEPIPMSAVDLELQENEPTQVATLALAGIPMVATATSPPATKVMAIPTNSPPAPLPTLVATPIEAGAPLNVLAIKNTEPAPVVPAEPRPVDSPGFSPILLIGGAALVVLIALVILLLRYEGG